MSLPISGGQVASEYQTLWNAIKRVQADSLNLQSSTAGGAACSLRVFLTLAQDTLMLRQIYDQYTADQTTATSIVAYSQQQAPGVIFSAADFTNMRTAAGNILTPLPLNTHTTAMVNFWIDLGQTLSAKCGPRRRPHRLLASCPQ